METQKLSERESKALAIATHTKLVRKPNNTWIVPSQSGAKTYTVRERGCVQGHDLFPIFNRLDNQTFLCRGVPFMQTPLLVQSHLHGPCTKL